MLLPKRFALSTLLLLMLVVASVLGYLQWRRQRIIADVKWLNGINGPLRVGQGKAIESYTTLPTLIVRDGILPEVQVFVDTVIPLKTGRLPIVSGIIPVHFVKLSDGIYRLSNNSESYSLKELKEQLREIQNRLNSVGFTSVKFCEHTSGTFLSNHTETATVDEIGE